MSSYSELLRDPRWQRKRLEVMNRADFTCEECGSSERMLNVHHRVYRKGAKPWEYKLAELVCLCELCHGCRHAHEAFFRELLDRLRFDDRLEVVLFACDLLARRRKEGGE